MDPVTHAPDAAPPRMPKRRELLRRGVILAALGLVTTIVVAWALALYVERDWGTMRGFGRQLDPARGEPRGAISGARYSGPGMIEMDIEISNENLIPPGTSTPTPEEVLPGWVLDWIQARHPAGLRAYSPFQAREAIDAFGWPMLALSSISRGEFTDGWHNARSGVLELPAVVANSLRVKKKPPGVPCRPLSVGIVVDTLAFGAAWGMLRYGVPAMVRWLRPRAHHCWKCRYDLRGLAPDSRCPECGAAPRETRRAD